MEINFALPWKRRLAPGHSAARGGAWFLKFYLRRNNAGEFGFLRPVFGAFKCVRKPFLLHGGKIVCK